VLRLGLVRLKRFSGAFIVQSASPPFFSHLFAYRRQPAFAAMDHVLGLVGKDFVLIAADMKVAHSVLTMKSDQDK
jgi:20S proteasome alpha/beta subunit